MKKKATLKNNFLNSCVYAISFFIYSGFYAILALSISFFGSGASRFVTIPVRLLTTVLMIVIIALTFRERNKKTGKKLTDFVFLFFWSFYVLKLFWHFSGDAPLRLFWLEYIFYSLNFVILPFFMFGSISFEKYKKTIIDALIFSGFAMGITTTYLYREILSAGIARIELYIYQNPDLETLSPLALSYASVLTIMLCVYKLLYVQKKTKLYLIYLLCTIGVSLIMFLLGASRGSVLALGVSLVYIVYHSNYKVKAKIGLLVLAMIPIFIWSVAASGSAVFERTTKSVSSGSTGREDLWADAWNEFLANPIFGGRIEIGFYPHNIILEILMATGVIGLTIVSILFVKGFIKTINLPKIDIDFLWVGIIFLQGFCQLSFSAALYQATLVFFPLGILLSSYFRKVNPKEKNNTIINAKKN
ncbi:O-antigen ligase family protein [uncultured Zobellia sp.]|uniref:O-antigen ligase family protein n=1 Tax=uncultured Zobellia sp. TaxID=255433 RepID=UPI002598B67B|nr:O-antigen ligase family protein [uncultured Zobellia sp.]